LKYNVARLLSAFTIDSLSCISGQHHEHRRAFDVKHA